MLFMRLFIALPRQFLRSAKTNVCSEIARARERRGAHARPRDAAFQISRLADGNARSSLKCRDGVFFPTSPIATAVIRILIPAYRTVSRSRISRMHSRDSRVQIRETSADDRTWGELPSFLRYEDRNGVYQCRELSAAEWKVTSDIVLSCCRFPTVDGVLEQK